MESSRWGRNRWSLCAIYAAKVRQLNVLMRHLLAALYLHIHIDPQIKGYSLFVLLKSSMIEYYLYCPAVFAKHCIRYEYLACSVKIWGVYALNQLFIIRYLLFWINNNLQKGKYVIFQIKNTIILYKLMK